MPDLFALMSEVMFVWPVCEVVAPIPETHLVSRLVSPGGSCPASELDRQWQGLTGFLEAYLVFYNGISYLNIVYNLSSRPVRKKTKTDFIWHKMKGYFVKQDVYFE